MKKSKNFLYFFRTLFDVCIFLDVYIFVKISFIFFFTFLVCSEVTVQRDSKLVNMNEQQTKENECKRKTKTLYIYLFTFTISIYILFLLSDIWLD